MNRRIAAAALLTLLAAFALGGCEDEATAPTTMPQVMLGTAFESYTYLSQPETLRALAADPDGIAAITFFVDGHEVHRATSEPYAWLLAPGYWLPGAAHTLILRADDSVGSTAFAGPYTFRVSADVDGPQPASPASGAEFPTGDIPLSWRPYANAAAYEVEVAVDAEFADVIYAVTTADTTATVPADRDAVCRWRVRARDDGDRTSPWSDAWSFDMGIPDPLVLADPAALMLQFLTAYSYRDIDLYEELLDSSFLYFFLANEDLPTWGKSDDLVSADNLFCGEARINSQGQLTHAISQVTVDRLILVEPWTDVAASHPDFGGVDGAQQALYQCSLYFFHPAGTITVECSQRFYAAPSDVLGWRLIGQEDQAGKASENMSWGSLKALYR